jgi:hypothetical protein
MQGLTPHIQLIHRLTRRVRLLLMLASIPLALSFTAAASADSFMYGVAGGSPTASQAGLSQLASANITSYRSDAYWEGAQPVPPPAPYQWSSDDAIVATLAGARLTWLPIVDYSTTWASATGATDGAPEPAAYPAYAAFAAALVARYGPGGTFWVLNPSLPYRPVDQVEIWNEGNNAQFWPQNDATPGLYYDLYAQSKTAVHAVSPSVTVIFGGLLDSGSDPIAWLTTMERQRPGSLASIQSLGWHPYLYSLPVIIDHLRALRALMSEHGAGSTPIAITEIGDSSSFGSQSGWASILTTLAAKLPSSGCGVTALLPFTWQDDSNPADSAQGWFPLSTQTGQLTAPGSAFAVAAQGSPTAASGWCHPSTKGTAKDTLVICAANLTTIADRNRGIKQVCARTRVDATSSLTVNHSWRATLVDERRVWATGVARRSRSKIDVTLTAVHGKLLPALYSLRLQKGHSHTTTSLRLA